MWREFANDIGEVFVLLRRRESINLWKQQYSNESVAYDDYEDASNKMRLYKQQKT